MSMEADIKNICRDLHEGHGIGKQEATQVYLDIESALEWDREVDYDDVEWEDIEFNQAYKELWGNG